MSALLAQVPGISVTNTQTVVTNADGSVNGTIVHTTRFVVSYPTWKVTAAGVALVLIIMSLVILFRRSKST